MNGKTVKVIRKYADTMKISGDRIKQTWRRMPWRERFALRMYMKARAGLLTKDDLTRLKGVVG